MKERTSEEGELPANGKAGGANGDLQITVKGGGFNAPAKMNAEMGMVVRRHEEREALRNVIAQWNANRLDLFELSEPNEELEFHGVMRFYFQDSGQKVATKCIRVASDATTQVVIETLIEKFRPDMRMLSVPEYALYEIHENLEERRLGPDEKPLLVQLNWHKDDREGRFLLRRIDDKTNYSQMPEGTFQEAGSSFKRKLSKREKKQLKKQEKMNRIKAQGNDENDSGVAEKLYNEKPETSFTRSISNPEAVMRRRRQQKLGQKLQAFRSKDGGPDTGGTLKIYGEALCRDVPYKTLLLSIGDSAAMVVKEMLNKYGLDKEDPNQYCLTQVNTAIDENKETSNGNGTSFQNGTNPREYILDDDECPLAILMNHPLTRGSIMFHVRRRPADYHPRKRKKKPVGGKWSGGGPGEQEYYRYEDDSLPFLLELNPDGSDIGGGTAKRYRLQPNVTEVGSGAGTGGGSASGQSLQLVGPNVQPRHCVIAHTEGIVTVTPCTRDAETYVNNQRIYETTILQNGCTVKFGRLHTFRFLDPLHDERMRHRHDSSRSHEYSYDRHSTGGQEISSLNVTNGPTETSTPQTAAGGGGAPSVGAASNYETTFDVDGNIETRSTSSLGAAGSKDLDTRSTRSVTSSQGNRLSGYGGGSVAGGASGTGNMIRGCEPILPAVLEMREETEEALLHAIITDVEPSAVGFKLAPAYTLYLAARYRASTHYRPELTPTERAHRLTLIMARVAAIIHSVIQERYCEPKWLAMWLANSSELLHFLKSDRHISAFSLDAQDTLADAVQIAFRHLVCCLQSELSTVIPNFLSDRDDLSHDPEDSSTASVLGVLFNAMSLLRCCRVNAALTIQLFSQLFNYINVWAFNRIVSSHQPNYCSRAWGLRIKARLAQITVWAERQGLELAADCHLAKIMQVAHLLQAPKYTMEDLANLSSTYFKLNSVQLRAILQKYQPSPDEPHIPVEVIDNVVRVGEHLADELTLADGREVRLEEEPELALPFLLPEDGYSCEVVRGTPPGLIDFVAPLQASGLARLTVQPSSNGLWTVYMGPMLRSPSAMSNRSGGFPPPHHEPEIHIIKLHKSNNGLGLSIVAAKGAGQDRLGIYIKSVVKGGAADADGRLQAGDQLLKVDGQSLIGITQEKAAEYLVRTGPIVTLEVAKQGAIYHGLATLLSQPSPIIGRGMRRMSERDLPSRVLSEQYGGGGGGGGGIVGGAPPRPHHPPLSASKSVPSLNTGGGELDRGGMMGVGAGGAGGGLNHTIAGMSAGTMPRQHDPFNHGPAGGYARTSSTNSIPLKQPHHQHMQQHHPHPQQQQYANSGYPNQQIRSRSSQNLTDGGSVGVQRGPSTPVLPGGGGGYAQAGASFGGGYPAYPSYQQGYHVHQSGQGPVMVPHSSGSGSGEGTSPDHERFYQNLSVYRDQGTVGMNGYPRPPSAKLPPAGDLRSAAVRAGSQSSLQSRNMGGDQNTSIRTDRPASAYLPPNGHLPHQGMQPRSQSTRDMMIKEAKLQEMGEELRRREMRLTSPTNRNQMSGVTSPAGMGRYGPMEGGYQLNRGPEYNESPPPPPPPPTSTHPLYHNQSRPNDRYSASIGEPPRGGFVPTSPLGQQQRPPSHYQYQGSNPWDREQKEKEAERRREVMRQWRDQQIVELGGLPNRTQSQEQQLRALKLEREFEKRAEEVDEEEDDDQVSEAVERVQGILRVAQQNDLERRNVRQNPNTMNTSQQSQQYAYSPSGISASSAGGTPTSSTHLNGTIRSGQQAPQPQQPPPQHHYPPPPPTNQYSLVSAEEKARLQRLKDLKMKQAEVEAERLKKKEDEMKAHNNMLNQQMLSSSSGNMRTNMNATLQNRPSAANLRLDNLVISTPNNNVYQNNNNGYGSNQTSPSGKMDHMGSTSPGSSAPPPPERGSSYNVMGMRNHRNSSGGDTTPSHTPQATNQTSSINTTPSKKVSFQEPPPTSPPSTDQPSSPEDTREDPNHFINEAENMLASPTSPDTTFSSGNTPGVIGAQEVYRDPRQKRLAEKQQQQQSKAIPEKMSFKEKMKMFAMETGEEGTPRDKVKISRAQRDIDNIGGTPGGNPAAANNNSSTAPPGNQ